MFCYNLSEVGHFLQQLGKELGGLGVVQLELELQRLQQVVLYVLNGLHIQQTWAVWGAEEQEVPLQKSLAPHLRHKQPNSPVFLMACFALVLK